MSMNFFTNRQKIVGLTIAFLCYLSVGCGPIYDTKYSFTLPETPQGKMCVSGCERTKFLCERDENRKQENCERQAKRVCEGRRDCYGSPDCLVDYSQCESRYRRCYQDCGGTVESRKVCVMGCR